LVVVVVDDDFVGFVPAAKVERALPDKEALLLVLLFGESLIRRVEFIACIVFVGLAPVGSGGGVAS
jgi:hypothetical protein